MVLFHPSEEFVRILFKYLKASRNKIKRETLSEARIAWVREKIGYSFRFSLVEFGNKMMPIPIRLCAIIEPGKPGFTRQLNEILQKHLKIGSDVDGLKLLDKLAEDFKNCLSDIGGVLEAEEEFWPYKRVYLLDNETVIMDLNLRGFTIDARKVN